VTRRSFFGLLAAAFVAKPVVPVDVFDTPGERTMWGLQSLENDSTYRNDYFGVRRTAPMFVGEDCAYFPPLRAVITQRKLLARVVDLT
jgi:hypothetical protein